MDIDEEYNRIYIRKSINDETSNGVAFELPTLHMILLYCEWFLADTDMSRINALIQQQAHENCTFSAAFSLEEFDKLMDDSAFASSLQGLVGRELYDYACAAVGDGEVAIPLGLAPSFWLFSRRCERCRCPAYIRSFCLQCGTSSADAGKATYRSPYKRDKLGNFRRSKEGSLNGLKRSSSGLDSLDSSHNTHQNKRKVSTPKLPKPTQPLGAGEGMMCDPETKAASVVTTYTLEELLALSRQATGASAAASAGASIIPSARPVTTQPGQAGALSAVYEEVEVVEVKKEIEVIDLISSSSEDERTTPDRADRAKQLNVARVPLSPAPRAGTPPVIKQEATSGTVHTEGTYKYATVTQSSEQSLKPPAGGLAHEEASDDGDWGLGSEDGSSLASVKMEWPARRMDKYEMCAMRGIAALYKFGQSQINPGDMLFLMRNLATNCTGLHRIAARCGFKKLCKRWVAEHSSLHGSDHTADVQDVIEGTFTLAQLIRPFTLSWEMYQETDTGPAAPAGEGAGIGGSPGTGGDRHGSSDTTKILTRTASDSSAAMAMWEDAEGRQENEADFAARIDLALACTNLKVMIYSLTGDRRYFTLKSEPGDESGGMVDLVTSEQLSGSVVTAKAAAPSTSPAMQAWVGVVHSEFIVYPPNYPSAEPGPPETKTAARKGTRRTGTQGAASAVPARRCNPLRSGKLALWENLAEEYGNLDQFGAVSEEVAQQFMDIAAVVATSKVFIRENIKYITVRDFIGIDLDAFAMTARLGREPQALGGRNRRVSETASDISSASQRRGSGSASSSSSSSSSGGAKGKAHGRSTGASRSGAVKLNYSSENCIDSKFHGKEVYTGALCWPYITEEIGFDLDLGVDKTRVGYQVKHSTLSRAVLNLARVRVYRGVEHFTSLDGQIDREAYKQQCYLATHVVYAFSDWGQHALRRHLFAEEFFFLVTNFATVLDALKDPELVGEFMHCLRILQYSPQRDPGLVPLFEDGKDFLLRVERDFGSMGKWVATRSARKEDFYTQYHATYCAVVGLADCHFAQDEARVRDPPLPRILHHLRSDQEMTY